jgi:hypothetical protein
LLTESAESVQEHSRHSKTFQRVHKYRSIHNKHAFIHKSSVTMMISSSWSSRSTPLLQWLLMLVLLLQQWICVGGMSHGRYDPAASDISSNNNPHQPCHRHPPRRHQRVVSGSTHIDTHGLTKTHTQTRARAHTHTHTHTHTWTRTHTWTHRQAQALYIYFTCVGDNA